MADANNLNTLIEFMKCFPLLVKKDKNSSQGMNYVMQAAVDAQKSSANLAEKKTPMVA